ncbi:MAG TPA: electron transfer flavoprotein subunit beta/FixA family protein [Thermotogota bacterium]|nr:electron transfer flavoprotein subunit beta/FixA family protein [Thermotogota bacterium]HRW34842.1 electron transfer flavoprotein subunit beta/FixA family protein [Thermotogota bacterium]
MRIAVLIKQVPDTDDVKLDPQTGTMIREGSGTIINPLDLNAIEAAVQIKRMRSIPCHITVITMGPPNAQFALREALALGADQAILLTDRRFAGADSWATAKVLAESLKKTGEYDLIIAGEKATDGETGQVGPEVAAMLSIPCATYVTEISDNEEYVVVKRMVEDGFQRQRIHYPCLITVLSDLNRPGMPTLKGKMDSRRATLITLTADDLDIRSDELGLMGSPTKVVRVTTPQKTRETRRFSGHAIEKGIVELAETIKSSVLNR